MCPSDKQGYQQSYDAALVGADRSKDIVVLRLLNLQVRPVSGAAVPLAKHACWQMMHFCQEVSAQPLNAILIGNCCLQEASCWVPEMLFLPG